MASLLLVRPVGGIPDIVRPDITGCWCGPGCDGFATTICLNGAILGMKKAGN